MMNRGEWRLEPHIYLRQLPFTGHHSHRPIRICLPFPIHVQHQAELFFVHPSADFCATKISYEITGHRNTHNRKRIPSVPILMADHGTFDLSENGFWKNSMIVKSWKARLLSSGFQ